ncbi:hypothetical protein Nepgr_025632 [Nepenthes gracilis]|uniref:histone acetyltransferase n=1 Tax=Nepenthes gracilis TaxID=150966 RepID=A0AAD3Y194_NEPGR|nr:hypothetical protein Nepgr_025632 [Nepenthes gracilis]
MSQKQKSTVSVVEPKKRRRVGFASSDAGIEASECIKIYLVSSKEEVEAKTGYCINPVDWKHFFENDGKIYGYQGLEIVVWVSIISFHAYVDVTYESISDGGKGITDLKTLLQNIFGEIIIEKKDEFFQLFSTESQYISSIVSSGEKLQQNDSSGNYRDSDNHLIAEALDVEVTRLVVGDMLVGHFYSRLVPLVLLLVDGSNPIDVMDSRWELYLVAQRITNEQGASPVRLLGFAAAYRFYHYPNGSRLRLSQILILPPYQRKGYGRCLLEALNHVAISENVYELTIEEPLDSLQCIRNSLDIPRLLACNSVQHAIDEVVLHVKEANLSKRTHTSQFLPPWSTVEDVRSHLKINKKQFTQCWEILIYLALDPIDKYMQNYRTFIMDRVKAVILGKDSGTTGKKVINIPSDYDEETSFVMYKSRDGESENANMDENQTNQEQQLQKLVDDRIEEINVAGRDEACLYRCDSVDAIDYVGQELKATWRNSSVDHWRFPSMFMVGKLMTKGYCGNESIRSSRTSENGKDLRAYDSSIDMQNDWESKEEVFKRQNLFLRRWQAASC